MDRASMALLAGAAVVLWPCEEEARTAPDGLSDRYEDIADRIIDLEPFYATPTNRDAPSPATCWSSSSRASSAARFACRTDVRAQADGHICEDVPEAVTLQEQELSAHVEEIADHIIDVEPFHAGDDEPERAIARHIARLLAADDPRPGTVG